MIKAIPYSHFISYLVLIIISFEILSFSSIADEEKQIIPVSDDEFPQWRYWSNEDIGINGYNHFSVDHEENLYINNNDVTYIFDSINIKPFQSFNLSTPFIHSGVNKQFWVHNQNIIQISDGHKLIKYDLNAFSDYTPQYFKNQQDDSISIQYNEFYILTNDGLYLFDVNYHTFQLIKSVQETPFHHFIKMRTNQVDTVWVIGAGGVAEIDISDTKTIEGKEWIYNPLPIEHSGTAGIEGVYPNGELTLNIRKYQDTLHHLYRLKDGKWDLLHSEENVQGWLGHDGGYWIRKKTKDGNNLFRFHIKNKIYEFKPGKYTANVVQVISQNINSFWISSNYGLTNFRVPLWRREEQIPINNAKYLDGLFHSPEEYYLLNHSQLITKQNNTVNIIDLPPTPYDGGDAYLYVNEHPSDKEKKWLFREKSLFEYNPNQTEAFTKLTGFDEAFHSIFIKPNNDIFLGLDEFNFKIACLENLNLHTIYQFHKKEDVRPNITPFNSFVIQNNGAIWFVVNHELHYVRDHQLQQPPYFSDVDIGKVWNIFLKNNDHVILIGDNGVFEFNGQEYKKQISNGLEYTLGFIDTKEHADWYATKNGLYRYQKGNWIENNLPEGLPEGQYNFVKSDTEGNIYVGGDMGFRFYSPEMDTKPPETYISKEENSSEFMVQKDIRIQLSGKDRWNFTQPDRLLYSYKIKQINFLATEESEWSAFQEDSTINLSHLKPMNYTIYARAMDRNMNTDPTPASFNFRVSPPWFYEPIFLVISTISTILITIFGYYAVRNHLKLVDSLHQTQRSVSLLERTKIRLTEAKTKAESEKKNAITATKAKDGFLARMSHEIRTPLNGVIGNLELIPSSELKPEKQYYLHTAKISANTLLEIIGDVLDFAKIEADKLELEEISVSLPALFEETISLMKTRAEEKEIALTNHFSQNVPKTVRVDPVRLRQVMINLIGNAVKFTDQGSVNVSLTCDSILDEIAVICLEVKDTGTGFDTSRKDELFREFEQDDTSNKTAEGTGLGLAICKRIVEMMGGTIDCDSHPGFGSRFWITLPLRIIDEPELEPTHTDDQSTAGQLHFEVQHPILVIDDKQTNLMLAKSQLSELRIDCDTAGGGQEALEKVKENAYSMILVDCSMPGMDGFEFTKEFRNSNNGTQLRIPVIAMTAHVVSDIQERCHAAGMDDYLSKPVRMDSLTLMLQKWLPSPGETTVLPEINEHDHVFSMEALSEFTSMRNPDDLVQYLTVVQQEMQSEYEQLLQAIQSQDRMVFRDRAHGLKGLSESVLFTPFAELMKHYQEQAGHISLESVENDSPKINEMILQFQEFVQTVQMDSELNKKDVTENVSSNK